jgi:hypothetical protein
MNRPKPPGRVRASVRFVTNHFSREPKTPGANTSSTRFEASDRTTGRAEVRAATTVKFKNVSE